jgi:hypothetical protein
MKQSLFFLPALALAVLVSCTQPAEKPEATEPENIEQTSETDEAEIDAAIDVDAEVAKIDAERTAIEALEISPVEVSTENLRSKIKQKWSKIHFYAVDGELVRVKTYPHAGISMRTEEFYLSNGELVLVTIEDNGEGERGKAAELIDKMYYYLNGELIREKKANEEAEYGIRNSDGEELMQELNEYKTIFIEATAK